MQARDREHGQSCDELGRRARFGTMRCWGVADCRPDSVLVARDGGGAAARKGVETQQSPLPCATRDQSTPRSMIVTEVPRVSFLVIGAVRVPAARQLSTSGATKAGSARAFPASMEELPGPEPLSAVHIDRTPASTRASKANMMQP